MMIPQSSRTMSRTKSSVLGRSCRASFSTAPAWQASSMTTSLPLMPRELALEEGTVERGRGNAASLDLGGKHVEDAVVVAVAVAREEDDPHVLGLHGVLEPLEPIEKSLLGGLAIDEPKNLDAGEGLGGLVPQDSLEEFGVIGGILEPERFILVVGDADQEGVEPGLGGALDIVDDLDLVRLAVADIALSDDGQAMPAGVQPHLPALVLLPAASGIVGHLLAALVPVIGPAVEQQTEGRDGVAGLGDGLARTVNSGSSSRTPVWSGLVITTSGGSTSFTTLRGSLSRSRAGATLPVLSASLITSGR